MQNAVFGAWGSSCTLRARRERKIGFHLLSPALFLVSFAPSEPGGKQKEGIISCCACSLSLLCCFVRPQGQENRGSCTLRARGGRKIGPHLLPLAPFLVQFYAIRARGGKQAASGWVLVGAAGVAQRVDPAALPSGSSRAVSNGYSSNKYGVPCRSVDF